MTVAVKEAVAEFGGRPVQWWQRGQGRPVVVFSNGCGLSAEHWRPVLDRLRREELVTFDRPGLFGTPWPGELPTLAQEVATLAGLVEEVGAPLILVAHSMAAFHAEAYARQYPGRLAGLVLVEPSAEFLATDPGPGPLWPARAVRRASGWWPLRRAGAWVHHVSAVQQSRLQMTHVWPERIQEIYSDPDSLAAAVAEFFAYRAQAWDLLGVRRAYPWPELPVTVLTAERPDPRYACQARLAALLGARQTVVTRSRHLMMVDRPDAVARAIHAVARE
ncbi:alpha/beta fold hydrolase [Granulicoccus phenolivorans]|uniref:alpha/beta fold hydrolase n=1 Tax=Granulicoccus phenolivorans TaxID=266854 RepID=UPI000687E1A5|nr:alpha/beta hydrolase [Granulicoccus phenolivorans]